MEALLQALREGDAEKIERLAHSLFVRRCGSLNRAQINEFEKFAPCLVATFNDSLQAIQYNDQSYMLN